MNHKLVKLVHSGNTTKLDFTRQHPVIDIPDLICIQRDSYDWFLNDGLKEAFSEYFPINIEERAVIVELLDYRVCLDEIQYDPQECKHRKISYEAPVRINVRITDQIHEELIEEEIIIGNMPIMTHEGTFIINGAEKILANQIVRSPGCYYDKSYNSKGNLNYSAQIIPQRGAWMEIESKNGIMSIMLDKTVRKKPYITTFLRMLGLEHDYEIYDMFGHNPIIEATLEKDTIKTQNEAYLYIYNYLKPSNPASLEAAKYYLDGLLMNDKRYSYDKHGRYKVNKKLDLKDRITGCTLAKDVINQITGQTSHYSGEYISEEIAEDIQNSGISIVTVTKDGQTIKVVSNRMVDASVFGEQFSNVGIEGKVYFPEFAKLVKLYGEKLDEDIIKANYKSIVPLTNTRDDILASISYITNLVYEVGETDNIDHLANRRIRCGGELLQTAYKVGLAELSKAIIDNVYRLEGTITAKKIFNKKIMNSVVTEYFNEENRTFLIDQDNPLSEVSQKRRITALGKGGIKSENAGYEVRDINYTHYGRLCPIETPEGGNIGLITNLAIYARLDKYGFIEVPYRKVDKSIKDKPRVTDEIVYMDASEDEKYVIAQSDINTDSNGYITDSKVLCRKREITAEFDKEEVDYVDVSPNMAFSAATNMIPFLQNDDANRALMGSNMMRQAVPLLFNDSAVVSTGIDSKIAYDSRDSLISDVDGKVKEVDSDTIVIEDNNGIDTKYKLNKFKLSISAGHECTNQRPNVSVGDQIKKGDLIADGQSTKNGELALGNNPLIGFMEWEGFNYEDGVLISERILKDDVYTSIHMREYSVEARYTYNTGSEEITRNMVGLPAYALRNLDDDGIIRIGAEVKEGDVLVGKTTPRKVEDIPTEDKIINEIFGIKTKKVKNTPLVVPHGISGTVIDVKRYSKDNGDKLSEGVLEKVIVYIAQKRKLSIGDKMAGRHGNKGIVTRILPVEDMPYLKNGRPLDIVLNPLGVPSRMNIGQILELHLGLLVNILGMKCISPIFNGATEQDLKDLLPIVNDYNNLPYDKFNKKYKDMDKELKKTLKENFESNEWKGITVHDGYKVDVYDGRSGEKLPKPISVGYMHYMKLHHFVDDKVHARSTGSYATITQQPLKGKAKMGGQRLGEMEVWALEAYGVASVLQEMMTIKSDDVVGRRLSIKSILNGESSPLPNIPETFKMLIKILQGLGLDVIAYDDNLDEIMFNADFINLKANKFIEDNYGFETITENVADMDSSHRLNDGYQMGTADVNSYEELDAMFEDEDLDDIGYTNDDEKEE